MKCDVIHDQIMDRNLSFIKKEYDMFVFLFLVDVATISIVPLLNIFPVALLQLVDCQGHISDSGKRMDPLYVLYFLSTHKSDPHHSITNVVMCWKTFENSSSKYFSYFWS